MFKSVGFKMSLDLFSIPTDVIIYAEKFEFKNPAIMEDKQCKQTERFSVMTKVKDYFLS